MPFPCCPPKLLCRKVEPAPQTPERVSLGNPCWECCGSRTRKVQADFLLDDGQAWDVRRQPHRARDRQLAQQSHSEQRHGRRLNVVWRPWLPAYRDN